MHSNSNNDHNNLVLLSFVNDERQKRSTSGGARTYERNVTLQHRHHGTVSNSQFTATFRRVFFNSLPLQKADPGSRAV
jgi:hypothetical protein